MPKEPPRVYTGAMRRDVLILTSAAIIAVGIGIFMFSSGRGDLSNTSLVTATVPFTEIAKGSQSAVERRVNYLITSSSQFNELWGVVTATGTPPKIDFKTHSVIAVFAGQKPTAGYAIAVAKIEDASARMVSITLAKPSDDCMLAQSITTPYQLISVPATSLSLAHEDISVTTTCAN